ncbi:hypothetical protein QUB24_09585 [Microcoleus sp. B9-D4]
MVALTFFVYTATDARLSERLPNPTPEGQIEVKPYPVYRSATVCYGRSITVCHFLRNRNNSQFLFLREAKLG